MGGIGPFDLPGALPERDEELGTLEDEIAHLEDPQSIRASPQATLRKAKKLPVFIEDDDDDHKFDESAAVPAASAPAPASASASAPPAQAKDDSGIDYAVYDDEPCFGEKIPHESLEQLHYIVGNAPAIIPGRVNVLYMWAKWDKAGYGAHAAMADLKAQHGDSIHVTAVSADPKLDYAVGFLEKEKYAPFSQPLRSHMTVAWDEGKTLVSTLKEMMEKPVLNLPHAFVINKFGKIVWREVFRPSHPNSLLKSQIANLLAGVPLIKVGMSPVELEDSYSGDADLDLEDGDDFALF